MARVDDRVYLAGKWYKLVPHEDGSPGYTTVPEDGPPEHTIEALIQRLYKVQP